MFCPKCAAKNLEGASFCRVCGANISLIPGALSGQLPQVRQDDDVDEGLCSTRRRRRGQPSIDAAMRNAADQTSRPTQIVGEELDARLTLTSRFSDALAQPAVIVSARLTVGDRPPVSVQWAGRSSGSIGSLCGGLGLRRCRERQSDERSRNKKPYASLSHRHSFRSPSQMSTERSGKHS